MKYIQKVINKFIFMKKQNKKAFNLIELIIVILILVILWTIAFFAILWYNKAAKNSVRVADISNINQSLELYYIKTGRYPEPDDYTNIKHEWILLWKQWIIWDTVIRKLNSINKVPLDPSFETNYTYSVNSNNTKYQVWYIKEN